MYAEVAQEIEIIEQKLALGEAPDQLLLRLDYLKTRRLPDNYPDAAAFARPVNPWRRVTGDLKRLESNIVDREHALRSETLTSYLELAYRTLADTGIEGAIELVRAGRARADLEDGAVHETLLQAALEVRTAALGR
jgi:hypothetical protein